MSYEHWEILIEGREPIDGWTVCTVCLQVDRTATTQRRKWRCSDCGADNTQNLQRPLRAYLEANPTQTLERNLQEWGTVKGVRPAYKMLKSARYKCLLTLSKRETGAKT
ncbi:MAG TPA: hypothetical protein VFJ95_10385 [Gammaproteobacteria bacterium]|jgi:hypothetical protein|nr:hypothetical protein [Gammaproteobacteria bacterium]